MLYSSIEYGYLGIKRGAKRQKNRTEAEMTKRQIEEVLLVRNGEETLHRSEDPLRSSELGDQSLKGLGYAAAKQPSPWHSEAPFSKTGTRRTLIFWAIDGPVSRGIKGK